MIERIKLQNFRCLKDVEISFGPMTVLIGPNASGKSSILEALKPGFSPSLSDVWGQRKDLSLLVQRLGASGAEFTRGWGGNGGMVVGQQFYSYKIHRLVPNQLRSENTLQNEGQLEQVGSNLTNVFASLTRQQQISLAQKLCTIIPVFRDLDTNPTYSGQHELRFQDKWNEEVWYRPHQVSDGTMLVLAFLILQYQPQAPDVIGIEEPERGLHPYLLERVVTMLRALAHGELGKPIQVVLATHSSELLNFAKPEEVRFVRRDFRDGATIIERAPTESPDWELAFKEYDHSLGEIWLSGSLGGV